MNRVVKLLAFVFFIGGQLCLAQEKAMLGNNTKAGKYADIRGIKIYYETYGKGEPLLLIHGNGGSIHDFHNQVAYFSKNYSVIVPDSRAQGKSVDSTDSLSYEMMADDFDALLEYLQLDACNVIGWSDGGINGLLLALRHSQRVKKLAITGTNLWPDTTSLDKWMYHSIIKWHDSLVKQPVTPKLKNEKKLVWLMASQPHINPNSLKNIKSPVLVIGGDHDVILPRHTLLIAESIPNSYLWILPNSGHSTLMTYKDEFNRIVLDFFNKPYRKMEGQGRVN